MEVTVIDDNQRYRCQAHAKQIEKEGRGILQRVFDQNECDTPQRNHTEEHKMRERG
jgi:hypothetical protein